MDSWQGKSKGTRFGYSIFVFIINGLGVLPAYFVLRFVALWYFFFSPASSRPLLFYFQKILGYGRLKSLRMLYRNYYQFGQTIIDKIVVMSGIKSPFTFEFDGEENLRKIAAGGKGGLLLSAHMGNWEIAGHFLKRLQTRISIVMYDGEHENIKEYLEQVVGKREMNIIVIKDDISHIYAINEALKNNELVCMHADRFVTGNRTITSNFLGREALFPAGPFLLAATFKVPVSYVFAFKDSAKHYHLYSSTPVEYTHLSKPELLQKMLQDYNREMEIKIKQYPVEWYNYYDFWKKG
jgi:predicted LPLAT superfamily acyltransferase